MRVLAVDDDKATLLVLQAALKSVGHEVITCSESAEAVGLVQSRRPDVILMDLNMRKPRGVEVIQQIRRQPETARIPIIVLSGEMETSEIAKAIESGATEFMAKPMLPSALIEKLKRFDLHHG